jgi:redox-sensitive bicupin YhaK (pirin superfamily)
MNDVLDHFPAPLGPLAGLRVVKLAAGDDYAQALERGLQVWVQALQGHAHVCGRELRQGQGVLLRDETLLAGYAEADSLLLVAEIRLSASSHPPAQGAP